MTPDLSTIPLAHAKQVALACQLLAQQWAEKGEIEAASFYGALAVGFGKLAAETQQRRVAQ